MNLAWVWKPLVEEAREQARIDIRDEFERLRGMGVVEREVLLECFISTHRGAKEIFQQVRTIRAHLDVSVPFASDILLKMACAIPIRLRRQNRLGRAMLFASPSATSHLPLAATFMPPSAPLLVHEVFRLVRRVVEQTSHQVFKVSGTRYGSPGLFGWLRSDDWVKRSGVKFCPEQLSFGTLISPEWMRTWSRRLDSGRAVLGQAKGFMGLVTLEMLYEKTNAFQRCNTVEKQEVDVDKP